MAKANWFSFWRFHPRFYRGFRTNKIFPELYWVISLEAVLIFGGLGLVLYFAIPETVRARERLQRGVERLRESKAPAALETRGSPSTQPTQPNELPPAASSSPTHGEVP